MSEKLVRLLLNRKFEEGQYWRHQFYTAGDIILHEGDTCKDIYVLLEGQVRVLGSVKLENDKTMRPGISDLRAGTVFGELAVFEDAPRTASVQALVDSDIAVINGPALLNFLGENPDLGFEVLLELMGTQANRLRKANKRVASLLAWGMKSHAIDSKL